MNGKDDSHKFSVFICILSFSVSSPTLYELLSLPSLRHIQLKGYLLTCKCANPETCHDFIYFRFYVHTLHLFPCCFYRQKQASELYFGSCLDLNYRREGAPGVGGGGGGRAPMR